MAYFHTHAAGALSLPSPILVAVVVGSSKRLDHNVLFDLLNEEELSWHGALKNLISHPLVSVPKNQADIASPEDATKQHQWLRSGL